MVNRNILVLLVIALLTPGCAMVKGPNRLMSAVGKQALENTSFFEGTVVNKCQDQVVATAPDASAADPTQFVTPRVLGCFLPVHVDGEHSPRLIFCSGGKFYPLCSSLKPLRTRVSFRGIPSNRGGDVWFPENIGVKEL